MLSAQPQLLQHKRYDSLLEDSKTNSGYSMYTELRGRRDIRLMKFLPGPTPGCTLITVDINKAPPYMALSYTWGSRILNDSIIVNSEPVAITRNLGNGLRRLHSYLIRQNLLLWADSICINQSDLNERSHQVKFMNAIYRCAECVGVWLGEASGYSDLVMERLEAWNDEHNRLQNSEACAGDYHLAMLSMLPSRQVFLGSEQSMQPLVWHAMRGLLHRDWWLRAWIVQEATVLAPSRTFFFCGDHCVDWERMRTMIRFFNVVGYYDDKTWAITFDQSMATRLDAFRIEREGGAYMRLLSVLETIRSFECEDPRDKVYASLGMAADVSEVDILPDYAKSVEEVYTDVARFVLSRQDSHSLDFLGPVIRPSSVLCPTPEDLPTWLPDWRVRCCSFGFEKYIDPYGFDSNKAYNANRDVKWPATIVGRKLVCRGFEVDTIVRVWSPSWDNLAESGVDIERTWRPEDGDRPYTCNESLSQVFNRTLLADIGRKDIHSDQLQRNCAIDWSLIDSAPSELTLVDQKRCMRMLVDIKRATFGRRLFQTDGELIGLGAAATAVGDRVCVLFGGQVLYLLRSKSGDVDHEFIGECYVHGMMDGEAVTDERLPGREFVIV